jgi:hypothetical protein
MCKPSCKHEILDVLPADEILDVIPVDNRPCLDALVQCPACLQKMRPVMMTQSGGYTALGVGNPFMMLLTFFGSMFITSQLMRKSYLACPLCHTDITPSCSGCKTRWDHLVCPRCKHKQSPFNSNCVKCSQRFSGLYCLKCKRRC